MHRVRRHDQEGTLVAFRGDLLDLRQTEHTLVGEALRGSEQGLQAAAHLRVHLDYGHPIRLGAEALPLDFRISEKPTLTLARLQKPGGRTQSVEGGREFGRRPVRREGELDRKRTRWNTSQECAP